MTEIKAKSSSVSSISSSSPLSEVKIHSNDEPSSSSSIPIGSIKKNRKLTLGEIQEVHDCSLIDGKLAFIITLRDVESLKGKIKVFKSDINTNSLRHAVPFAALCTKNGCNNVNELEEKLKRNESISCRKERHRMIEISCDSATSLKQLASIASVVNNESHSPSPEDKADSDYKGNTTASESPKSTITTTYNLRSKKRKFREVNDEDIKHNTNNRPSALKAIPNTISIGPTLSPSKPLNGIHCLRSTVSAPNTPLLNGAQRKAQIINLVHSPTLKLPQISLPQGNFTLLGPLNQHNNRMNELQQIILLQKRLQKQQIESNRNGIITQITNLNPIQALPRLESDNDHKEPPNKKVKLSPNIKGIEPFWSERLRLDAILNTHKVCLQKMESLDSMESWTHIIRTLQSQRLELLKVQQSICVQWQNYHIEANRYNIKLNQIIKHNAPKKKEYTALKSNIDEYKKQITEIYEKISKLSVKRKVLEKQMQSANQKINKCSINISQISYTMNQLKNFISDKKDKAHKLIEFIKTIDVISKEYCKSVEILQDKVVDFECEYEQWNSGEVVTWFENIDKGLLNKSESFLKFKTQLISNGVTGKDLIDLNHFSLKMMGLKDDNERRIIINHLNKLLIHSKGKIDLIENKQNNDKEINTKDNDNDNK